MGIISIRNLDEDVILRLNNLAKKAGVSPEEYIRNLLAIAVERDIIDEYQNKYAALTRQVINIAQEAAFVLEKNSALIEEVIPLLEEIQEKRQE